MLSTKSLKSCTSDCNLLQECLLFAILYIFFFLRKFLDIHPAVNTRYASRLLSLADVNFYWPTGGEVSLVPPLNPSLLNASVRSRVSRLSLSPRPNGCKKIATSSYLAWWMVRSNYLKSLVKGISMDLHTLPSSIIKRFPKLISTPREIFQFIFERLAREEWPKSNLTQNISWF